MNTPQWLTKQEAEERFRFDPEDMHYCPECLTALVFLEEDGVYYCPNEMCLNENQYDFGGAIVPNNG
jgi:hypothetical protein